MSGEKLVRVPDVVIDGLKRSERGMSASDRSPSPFRGNPGERN